MLDATAHILARGEPLTTNRVAEVAGVSIGSLYQYFPSKEALVAALVERMLEDDLAWVDAQLGEGPLRSQIGHLVRGVCERQAAQAPLMGAVLPLLVEVERDAVARQMIAEMTGWLRDRLRNEPDLRDELRDEARLEKALFVAMSSLRWSLNETTQQHPEWLSDPTFHAELERLFEGLYCS